MGTSGMRYSLPSRDIIADSMETVVGAMSYDGMITVVGDKNMPGALMAMLRLDRPSILVYGGTIASGKYNNQKLDVVSAFEAWGQKVAGKMDQTNFNALLKMHVLVQVRVVECTQQTPWRLPLKLWGFACLIIHPLQLHLAKSFQISIVLGLL